MPDTLTKKQRSYCMSRVKGRNTKLERTVRKQIWSKGFRYRIEHGLPGKPDIVFPFYRVAVFIDGCFWHRCPQHYQIPETNRKFWEDKLSKTRRRDREVNNRLRREGWKVIRVWEHKIKKNPERTADGIIKALSENPL